MTDRSPATTLTQIAQMLRHQRAEMLPDWGDVRQWKQIADLALAYQQAIWESDKTPNEIRDLSWCCPAAGATWEPRHDDAVEPSRIDDPTAWERGIVVSHTTDGGRLHIEAWDDVIYVDLRAGGELVARLAQSFPAERYRDQGAWSLETEYVNSAPLADLERCDRAAYISILDERLGGQIVADLTDNPDAVALLAAVDRWRELSAQEVA